MTGSHGISFPVAKAAPVLRSRRAMGDRNTRWNMALRMLPAVTPLLSLAVLPHQAGDEFLGVPVDPLVNRLVAHCLGPGQNL